MIAPIHPQGEEPARIIIGLFYSGENRSIWFSFPGLSTKKRLDDGSPMSDMLRYRWMQALNDIKAIERPLNTIFILSTDTDAKTTKIIGSFDTDVDSDKWKSGAEYVDSFDSDPMKLLLKVHDMLEADFGFHLKRYEA